MDVVIKPTYRCNLDCRYCCIHVTDRDDLSSNEAKRILEAAAARSPEGVMQARWHGGEPLCMGYEWFEEVFWHQKSLPVQVNNVVFTNLLLLGDDFLQLFKDNNVIIFTSLDAVDSLLDEERGGRCEDVMGRLDALECAGYSDVTVKTTVTSANLAGLVDTYDYLKGKPFEWNFAPVFPAGRGKEHCLEVLPSAAEFASLSGAILDDWVQTGKPRIYLFRKVIEELLRTRASGEIERPMFNVDAHGDVYRCIQFQGNKDYKVAAFGGVGTIDAFEACTCEWSTFHFASCDFCDFTWICKFNHCSYLGDSLGSLGNDFAERYCALMRPLLSRTQQALTEEIGFVLHDASRAPVSTEKRGCLQREGGD
ncbi:MAG: radical SAM protein [Coriobacteriales bacterium]|jgi:uncharacterized protein|nr:radical SAM protein [Coriobacteriales bacterium]